MISLSINKINLQNKFILASIAFLLIYLILIYFIVAPSIDNIKQLRADLINLKVELMQNVNKDSNSSRIGNKLEKVNPQLDKLNNIFLNESREVEFITTLEDVASKNKVMQKINLSATPPTIESSIFKKSSIDIETQGNYINLMSYLYDLGKLAYYINISKIEITNDISGNSQGDTLNTNNDAYHSNSAILKINAYIYWK